MRLTVESNLEPTRSDNEQTRNASSQDWRVQAADNGVAWMLTHRAAILRHAYVAQLAVGLFLLLFGYAIGKEHLHLIRGGARTAGTIVDYKEEHWATRAGKTRSLIAFMPIVEFPLGDRVIQFKDWKGSNVAVRNVPVTVLYDPANPSVAMIDRPLWNWIPWGPTMAVGFFLILVGARAFFRSRQLT